MQHLKPLFDVKFAEPSAGRVFWITGLSGAGKTTVGRELWRRLRATGRSAVFLDGDILRAAIGEDLDHSTEDRRRSAMRNARLCLMLASQGEDVVCATISLFHEVQRWNRENIPGYCEIYLQVPLNELRRRDCKGIYAAAKGAHIGNVVGLDLAAEVPKAPDLVVANFGALDSSAAVDRIWKECVLREGAQLIRMTSAVSFATKAETLEALESKLTFGRVLPQVRFSVSEWQVDRGAVLARITSESWGTGPLIVRSSARGEDGPSSSQAGRYDSVADVVGAAELTKAIEQVFGSYGKEASSDDQAFVQPLLGRVSMAGVAFSRRPNGGGPYYIINYDNRSGRTNSVTAGVGDDLCTFVCLKSRIDTCPPSLQTVVALLGELEILLSCDALDVEFAVKDGLVYLLQVRRLVVADNGEVSVAHVDDALNDIARKVELLSRPHPYLHGSQAIFGVMPDWNPAEIIGLRPWPLSLSLYRELITDTIWAYQRDNYGYQNLRSFPLLVSFHGLPYIDVRVSFNSFIPRDLSHDLAGRLVNHYIECLVAEPHLHDKVEFEIIFSCFTFDLPQRISRLSASKFSNDDISELSDALLRLTNHVMHGETALWRSDRAKIDVLAQRLPTIYQAEIDKISKIYWLIEDCKRYGTLPFAGLARAGFIAVQLLQSFVSVGVISVAEHAMFMASIDTVGSRIGHDFAQLPRAEFLARYGHLRPGTYDILSPRYDEAPDLYFDWSAAPRERIPARSRFVLSIEQLRQIEHLLTEHRLEIDVLSLMEFVKTGIEGREYAKFVFTRSLSDALSLIKQLGRDHGLSVEDCAYIDFEAIRALYSESGRVETVLKESIARGRRLHALTRTLVLPPLIVSPRDVYSFHIPPSEPNFITSHCVTAPVASISDSPCSFAGKILFVPSADPGFDWIFTRGIKGFVTQFGGVNSHMAIRAGELGVPAVIGAGESYFQRWGAAKTLCLDCTSQKVLVIA